MAKLLIIDQFLRAKLLPGGAKAADDGSGGAPPSSSGRLLKFVMPNDHEQRLFLLQDTILYELQQPTMDGKTSWFMDDEVVSDGSFYLATPFQVRRAQWQRCDSVDVLAPQAPPSSHGDAFLCPLVAQSTMHTLLVLLPLHVSLLGW